MVSVLVVTRAALLIARRASTWTIDEHLSGRSPECVAVDPRSPTQVYCGTGRAGLFRSRDSGRNWEPVGRGIDHPMVQRQRQVLIRRDPADVEGVTSVRDVQCTQVGIDRDDAIRIVASTNGGVEWRLVGSEKCRRRHDGYPSLGERLLQTRTRMPVDFPVWVRLHEDLIR